MTRYFLFPFRSAAAILVLTFTLGLTLSADAGLLGIPAGLLFISWFLKYCFVVLDAVIAGAEEPPVLDIEMVNPLSEQRPLGQAIIIAAGTMLTLWVGRHVGERWAYVCGAVLVLMLPASIAVAGVKGSSFAAVWPPYLIALIRGTRWHYLIPVALMLIVALGVVWMIPAGAPIWLWIAASQVLFLLTFSVVGGVVHENRFELGVDTLTRQERQAVRIEQEHQRARSQMLDRAYAKFNVREPLAGWNEIQDWLAHHTDDAFTEHRAILKATSSWPDIRPADRLASDLIAALLSRGRTGEALEVVESRLRTNPQYRPAPAAHTVRLAELAGLAGKRALQRLLAR